MASHSKSLREALTPVVRRMQLNAALQIGMKVLFGVSLLWFLTFSVSKFFIFKPWVLPAVIILGLLAILIFAAIQCGRYATLSKAARLADQHLGLKERLSTVWELDEVKDQSEVANVL